jgi:hypothetical protein
VSTATQIGQRRVHLRGPHRRLRCLIGRPLRQCRLLRQLQRLATRITSRLQRAHRTELRIKYLGEGRDVDVAEYVPKMNVTPNAVALKDD